MDRIGRYKIVRELGRGAMGVVYHAIDPNIGRPVAIKTIHFGTGRKPEELDKMRERLFREARSAGRLSHPGIVTIYDVDQQDDIAYIAMEYVDGPTLDQVLSDSEALDAERLFSVLGQTAVALDYAHSKGIVHRDIKPANIMLADDGTAKIADFGIAKMAAAENLTMTGSIVGTPHYMSPEQVQGQTVDGRSDQFSLAVISYEMLTGEKPYTGEHLTTVVYKIVAEEPVPPHRLNPSLSGAIETVLRRALAKKPDARYRTCQEFVQSLEKACSESRGWKSMPRGGLLNAPTLADVKLPGAKTPQSPLAPVPVPAAKSAPVSSAVLAPPRRKSRPEVATTTATKEVKKKSGFPVFLFVILLVAGVLAGIGWQFAPLLMPGRDPGDKGDPTAAVVPKETPKDAPKETQPAPVSAPPVKPPEVTASPADAKPSPVGPAEPRVAASPPVENPRPSNPIPPPRSAAIPRAERTAPSGPLQAVTFLSSPAGATVTVDGNRATCVTPCTMSQPPGRHVMSLQLAGYPVERREFTVGNSPQELAPVALRQVGGTLWLTSVPTGAQISINGRRIDQLTPAVIPLSFGVYTVQVEKDGMQATEKIDIADGIVRRQFRLSQ